MRHQAVLMNIKENKEPKWLLAGYKTYHHGCSDLRPASFYERYFYLFAFFFLGWRFLQNFLLVLLQVSLISGVTALAKMRLVSYKVYPYRHATASLADGCKNVAWS